MTGRPTLSATLGYKLTQFVPAPFDRAPFVMLGEGPP
jgi:hypothetical protein